MDKGEDLIGKSAGEICYNDIEATDYVLRKVIEAAELVWEDYKSAWLLIDYWADGTTVWESPDEKYTATVSSDGNITSHKRLI